MCYNNYSKNTIRTAGEGMTKGKLYVISGPSGAGKGTICKRILQEDGNIRFSVSMTTRAPRKGEKDRVDYYFVTREEFEKLLSEGGLLEHNKYVNNYYGTPRRQVVQWLEEGHDVAHFRLGRPIRKRFWFSSFRRRWRNSVREFWDEVPRPGKLWSAGWRRP